MSDITNGVLEKVFAVYDSKAGAFLPPFFAKNEALAVRSFSAAVLDGDGQFKRFAEDYTLFELASYDPTVGSFFNHETPHSLVTAMAILATEKLDGQVEQFPITNG